MKALETVIQADQSAWDDVLDQFEEAWQNEAPPDLRQYVTADASPKLAEELIRIDLEHRWQRDACGPLLESYLADFPWLVARREVSTDLIAGEYLTRQVWGDRPRPAEYDRRFPAFGQTLRTALAMVDVHLARESQRRWELDSRGGSAPARPVITAAGLLTTLRRFELLTLERLASAAALLEASDSRPTPILQDLCQRGWLTAFQADCLRLGRGGELRLGKYVLLDDIGAGGSGRVFRASVGPGGKVVSLKVFHQGRCADPEIVGRFNREVRAAALLDHPNIARAVEAPGVSPFHALEMDWVPGIDLRQLVKANGALPVERAVDYLRQAALGLQHAHERGLVHRDVKPGNLLVIGAPDGPPVQVVPPGAGRWGLVRILDLGLARISATAQREPWAVDRDVTSLVTAAETAMLGTPDYLAPEQAMDFHRADTRSDIYSLGCTLYFMLTGRPPFPADALAQKLLLHQQEAPPPLSALRPDVPAALTELAASMLAKDPAERPQTPGDVAERASAMGKVAAEDPPFPLRPRKRTRRALTLVSVGLAVALIVRAVNSAAVPEPDSDDSAAINAPTAMAGPRSLNLLHKAADAPGRFRLTYQGENLVAHAGDGRLPAHWWANTWNGSSRGEVIGEWIHGDFAVGLRNLRGFPTVQIGLISPGYMLKLGHAYRVRASYTTRASAFGAMSTSSDRRGTITTLLVDSPNWSSVEFTIEPAAEQPLDLIIQNHARGAQQTLFVRSVEVSEVE